MPTKAQIESITQALRKSVSRWNKAKLKLDKAQQAYEKAQAKYKKIHGSITNYARKHYDTPENTHFCVMQLLDGIRLKQSLIELNKLMRKLKQNSKQFINSYLMGVKNNG